MAYIKNLKQEWTSGNSHIIYLEKLNKFTGQFIPTFEWWEYKTDSRSLESIIILMSDGVESNTVYKIISRLGNRKGVHSDFKELSKCAFG